MQRSYAIRLKRIVNFGTRDSFVEKFNRHTDEACTRTRENTQSTYIHIYNISQCVTGIESKQGGKGRKWATRVAAGLNIHPRSIEQICNFGAFVLHERAGINCRLLHFTWNFPLPSAAPPSSSFSPLVSPLFFISSHKILCSTKLRCK